MKMAVSKHSRWSQKMPKLVALSDRLIGQMVDGFGVKSTNSGLVLVERDGTNEAIRPRWFKLTSVGSEWSKTLKEDMYVLVEHGRWSRKIKVEFDSDPYFRLDPKGLILWTDNAEDMNSVEFVK